MRFRFSHGDRPIDGYTIIRGVGIGGFGEVYYARSDGGKDVAIKVIRSDRYDVELRGVRQCLNLKHPNLIDIYDIRSNDEGDYFLIMEYVAGKSLAGVLEEHPDGLPIDEVRRWFEGIAAAVGYLHRHGIVHRDLKPQNIFQEEGVVKVGDYGLSKHITASQQSGHTTTIGTVHYMAPEVGSGHYGQSIDIFAVGIILYEMLTGKKPFDGESVGEVLMGIATKEPDYDRVPPQLVPVLQMALAKDPAQRYTTMEQFAADFRAALDEGQAHTIAAGEIKKPTRPPEATKQKHPFDRAFERFPKSGDRQRIPLEKILIQAAVTTLVLGLLLNIGGSLMGSWMAFAVFALVAGLYLVSAGWGWQQRDQNSRQAHLVAPPPAQPPAAPAPTPAEPSESYRPLATPVSRPGNRGDGPSPAPVELSPASSAGATRGFGRTIGYSLVAMPLIAWLCAAVLVALARVSLAEAAVATCWLALTGLAVIFLGHFAAVVRLDSLLTRVTFAAVGMAAGTLLVLTSEPWHELPLVPGIRTALAYGITFALVPWVRLVARSRPKRVRWRWVVGAFVIALIAIAVLQSFAEGYVHMRHYPLRYPDAMTYPNAIAHAMLIGALALAVQLGSPWTETRPAVHRVP